MKRRLNELPSEEKAAIMIPIIVFIIIAAIGAILLNYHICSPIVGVAAMLLAFMGVAFFASAVAAAS